MSRQLSTSATDPSSQIGFVVVAFGVLGLEGTVRSSVVIVRLSLPDVLS